MVKETSFFWDDISHLPKNKRKFILGLRQRFQIAGLQDVPVHIVARVVGPNRTVIYRLWNEPKDFSLRTFMNLCVPLRLSLSSLLDDNYDRVLPIIIPKEAEIAKTLGQTQSNLSFNIKALKEDYKNRKNKVETLANDLLEVKASSLKAYCSGANVPQDIDVISRVGEVFKISVDDLLYQKIKVNNQGLCVRNPPIKIGVYEDLFKVVTT